MNCHVKTKAIANPKDLLTHPAPSIHGNWGKHCFFIQKHVMHWTMIGPDILTVWRSSFFRAFRETFKPHIEMAKTTGCLHQVTRYSWIHTKSWHIHNERTVCVSILLFSLWFSNVLEPHAQRRTGVAPQVVEKNHVTTMYTLQNG